jgi:alpha-L-fucosidase
MADEWWGGPKLGLMLTMGAFSQYDFGDENVMLKFGISRKEYEKNAKKFSPVDFDAGKAVESAMSAGYDFLCLPVKRHDGFCLWATKYSDFSVMSGRFSFDILKMVSDACRQKKFPLALYYSCLDWNHKNYPFSGLRCETAPQEGDKPDRLAHMDYIRNQTRELCTSYGDIHGLWFDNPSGIELDKLILEDIRRIQPRALVRDSLVYLSGPDRRPADTVRDKTPALMSVSPSSFALRSNGERHSVRHMIQTADTVLSSGGIMTVGAGLDSNGLPSPEQTDIVSRVGDWYRRTKEAFDGASPCPLLTKHALGIGATLKSGVIYIHFNKYPEADSVDLKPLAVQPESASALNDGSELEPALVRENDFWGGPENLRLKNLPAERFSNEVIIARLEFRTLDGIAEGIYEPSQKPA